MLPGRRVRGRAGGAGLSPGHNAFSCGACPAGYAGNGTACFPCPLAASILYTSFAGTAKRAVANTIYGAAAAPAAVGGFSCGAAGGLSIGWQGFTAGGATLQLGAANQAYTPTLLLPANTLPAGQALRFVLRACYAANPDDSLCGASVVTFSTASSALVPVIAGGNTFVSAPNPVMLDASGSADPDAAAGEMEYAWACAPPPDFAPGVPCVDNTGAPVLLPAAANFSVLLLATPAGANYTFSLTINKGPTRFATAAAWVVAQTNVVLPVISVTPPPVAKVNPSAKVTVLATVTSVAPATRATNWSVVAPAAFAGLLAQPGVALTPASSPSLVIAPGALPPRTSLTLRLTATDVDGTSTADVTLVVSGTPYGTAGGPGTLGGFTVSPAHGYGLQTRFTLAAGGWADADLPLLYSFSYAVSGGSANGSSVLLTPFSPSPTAVVTLPAGTPDGGYAVLVTASVQNSAGAVAVAAPVTVTVEWAAATLASSAATAAVAANQTAAATAQLLAGTTAAAVTTVSGIASLLNVASASSVPPPMAPPGAPGVLPPPPSCRWCRARCL